MRYGLITPVVLLNPRTANAWEREAGIGELVTIAEAADHLGFAHLTASNHVAIPSAESARRGKRYWDPAVTLGFLAARTSRIRLATFVLVLGYHHPLEIVKRYGTLDVVSGGRLILGLGVGSLEEEFRLLGRQFANRGEAANDAVRAIRASLGKREPEYHGSHFDFAGVTVEPTTLRQDVPIWIGGCTARSLRRAIELDCDAWTPFALEPEAVRDLLGRARETAAWNRRSRPLEIGLAPEPPLDPLEDAAGAREELERLRACGATFLNLRFRSRSLPHHLDQMAAFADEFQR